jgi:hypothetical protein
LIESDLKNQLSRREMEDLRKKYDIESLKKQYNKKMKVESQKRDFASTLWLSKVKNFYEKYKQDLGYNRGDDKRPRKYRPTIVACRKNEDYIVFFLSTKGSYFYKLNVEENCKSAYCPIDFKWEKESKIFMDLKQKKIKFIRLKREDLDELMYFCSSCYDFEIKKIAGKKCSKKY